MPYILSLDQGTTSSRAILFNQAGEIVASSQKEFQQIYPDSGWVEHDPYDILTSQLSSASDALIRAGARPRDIAALGITNQRETVIVWDRETNKPVYNAIVWQDRRTAHLCHKLVEDGAEDNVRSTTGLLIDPYFSASKIAWILDNVSDAREKAEAGKLAFGTVDSWLIWNLTSGHKHVTDYTNASRTMLFNIIKGEWDDELLRLFKIPRQMMPEVVWSSGQVGEVTTTLGLSSIPIAGIAGDQQSALFGQLCLNAGDAKNTYGTGCFLLQNIGDNFVSSKHRLITTLVCSLNKKLEYAFEGSIFIGGAVVQWLRDNLKLIRASSDVEALAQSVKGSDGLVLVPAFVGLGAPHWDAHAGGLLIGLRRSTQPGHIARAALESIAFQVADVIDAMNSESDNKFAELRVDGGAAANDMLMQFQADLLGIPVLRPPVIETTALGAAYLAGLAVGFWSSPEEIWSKRRNDTRFEPKTDSKEMKAMRQRWQYAVERSKHWTQDEQA
ncbi:glycerol kinase GlpK [Acidobacterium sp. S8]|uniref:glycerol kinase GlpK n=1 Tax=Acidobacterium sp. S8 TaxID=1641854 RepID=UPI00131ECC6D|nr:glycerol kinase GlpK [Acidobacterium sp. S8]